MSLSYSIRQFEKSNKIKTFDNFFEYRSEKIGYDCITKYKDKRRKSSLVSCQKSTALSFRSDFRLNLPNKHLLTMSNSSKPRILSIRESLPFYLIGVEVNNFKSYRRRHLISPFTELTAIIGPNGSGKSNLMDAIAFALMVKSSELRVKNLTMLSDSFDQEHLKGTIESSDDSKFVYVELIFKSRHVEFDTLLKLRRSLMLDDLHEEYFVDNMSTSKSFYNECLIELGFNEKNQMFLIFQEKITQLITSDPKDLTSVVEELSGSHRYKNDYDALKKSIEEKEIELMDLMREKKTMLKSRKFLDLLDTDAKKSSELIFEVENNRIKLLLLQIYYTQYQIETVTETLNKNSVEFQTVTNLLRDTENEKNSLQERLKAIDLKRSYLSKDIREAEIQNLTKNSVLFDRAKNELDLIEKRLKNSQINLKKLHQEKKMKEMRVENLQISIEKSEQDIINFEEMMKNRPQIDTSLVDQYQE